MMTNFSDRLQQVLNKMKDKMSNVWNIVYLYRFNNIVPMSVRKILDYSHYHTVSFIPDDHLLWNDDLCCQMITCSIMIIFCCHMMILCCFIMIKCSQMIIFCRQMITCSQAMIFCCQVMITYSQMVISCSKMISVNISFSFYIICVLLLLQFRNN